MINTKMGAFLLIGFVAGAFVASPELRAYAANTVRSSDIIDESILSQDIKNGEVKNSDIANGAVSNSKLAGNAVSYSKIAPGSIDSSKIQDGKVALADLALNSVDSSTIADGAIAYLDLNRSFVRIEHRDDCNCGGTGWDPDGTFSSQTVVDDTVLPKSVISISVQAPYIVCSASSPGVGGFLVDCNKNIPSGAGLNYAIFNKT
jgi:hypothetical protein